MKVIAGIARGCNLKSPNGLEVRPTIARIKESIFNVIMPEISGSFFLDLFSGSGAIGIEALSRGSYKTYFVEKNKLCVNIIKNNLALTKLDKNAEIICKDVRNALNEFCRKNILFDIIFMDPPYYKNLAKETLFLIAQYKLLKENGIIISEIGSREILDLPIQFDFFKIKRYNTTTINYIKERKK